jgi:hypothetical protein
MKGQWTLVEERAHRIVVEVIEAGGAVMRHEYEPVDADQLALRDAGADGRMVRVLAPK